MNAVQLFVRSAPFGPTGAPLYQWYLLDLFEADPIKLNLSVASITDPLKVASAYTRSFRIPNTQKNSEFFRTAFLINTEDFDPARKIPAYINQSGETLVSGSIRLNSIIQDKEKQTVAYEIGFFGETSDFATNIAGKYMSDLNMTMFNHVRNAASIQNSWTASGILGGAIRYPLIEWGYTYDSTPAPTIPTLSNGYSKSFTTTSNPLKQNQFKPAIKLKVLWDAIMSQTVQPPPTFSPYTPQVGISGYTYSTDSFMNSSIFGNLYILISDGATAELQGYNTFNSNVNYSQGFYANAGQDSTMYAVDEIADAGNNFVPSTSIYTAPATGNYVFHATQIMGYMYTGGSLGGQMQGKIKLKITPLTGPVYYIYSPYGTQTFVGGQIMDSGNLNVPGLTAGSKVQFVLEMNAPGGPYAATSYWVRGGVLDCTLAPQLMNIQQLMPNNIKITDFIRAVVDRFKLVFIPNKDNPREFKVVPWVDWVRTGEAKDWTTKLDLSKDFKMTPLWEGLTRNNVFRDAEDGDYLNYNYTLATKQTYGQLNLDSANELLVGETVRTSIFAPTPLDSIANASTTAPGVEWNKMLIPHLAKDTTGTREPIQPKLRLVFWNGLIGNTGTPSATYKWYMRDDTTLSYIGFESYPLVSQFQNWPANSTGTLNLSFQNTAPRYNVAYGPVSNPNAATNLTQYNAYWRPWYSLVYNKYSKLVECTFNLEYMDIKELKFNDKIWVNDAWYLIDSVSDYIIGETTNVKVKMYKISNDLGLANISGVTVIPGVSVCFGNSACAAKCCNGGTLATFTVYTPTPAAMVVGVSVVYMDPYGNIPAAPGYYKYGGVVWQVGVGGFFVGILTPSCICTTGTGGTQMRTAYSETSLDSVSCATPIVPPDEVYVWGRQSDVLEDNIDFFIDEEMTTPAPSGYYRYLDFVEDPGSVVEVFEGTYNYSTDIQFTNCPSPSEYYPYIFGYSESTPCDACCFARGTEVYWSIDSTLVPGSILYTDFGITVAPDGEYSDGTDYYTLNTDDGEIAASAVCGCSCAPYVDIDLEMTSNLAGFAGYIELEKSFNAVDWLPVGTMAFPDTTPADTPVTQTFQVEEKAYTRVYVGYDGGPSGGLYLDYLVNDEVITYTKAPLPLVEPLTADSPDYATPGVTRKWRAQVFG